MTDQVTAPDAERPASLNDLRRTIDDLVTRAEEEETTLARFVELSELKRTLDQALTASGRIKTGLADAQASLLDAFGEEGVSSKRHADSGKLAYINRRVWARPAEDVDKAEACVALRAAGLGDFVSEGFNTQTLSSYFGEQIKAREADGVPVTDADLDGLLPDELRGQIELTPDHKIGVRS